MPAIAPRRARTKIRLRLLIRTSRVRETTRSGMGRHPNSRVGATFHADKAEPTKDLLCFRFCHNGLMAYRLSDDATPGGAEGRLRRPGVIQERLGRRSARARAGARAVRGPSVARRPRTPVPARTAARR